MQKFKKVSLERVTQPIGKQDTQPMHSVTGEMVITWNTPRATPLPVSLDEDITEKRHIVTPDEWLVMCSQHVELASDDDWLR